MEIKNKNTAVVLTVGIIVAGIVVLVLLLALSKPDHISAGGDVNNDRSINTNTNSNNTTNNNDIVNHITEIGEKVDSLTNIVNTFTGSGVVHDHVDGGQSRPKQ